MANKCLLYTALAIVFLGIGAFISGLVVYYAVPGKASLVIQTYNAQCMLESHNGSNPQIKGTIEFSQSTNENLMLKGTLYGIKVGMHGFHIHEFGVQRADCTTSKGHYNPYNVDHGKPSDSVRHVGDLGNIDVEVNTSFELEISDHVALLYGTESVIGRAIVIHERVDDFSQPTGNAGGRVACCTIMHLPSS